MRAEFLGGTLFRTLPTAFLPDEDQGAFFVFDSSRPTALSYDRTNAVSRKLEHILVNTPGVERVLTLGGLDFSTNTNGANVSTLFMRTKPWDERRSKNLQIEGLMAHVKKEVANIPEATITVFGFPAIQGLSFTGGFQYVLEDRNGTDIRRLSDTAESLVQAAALRPEISNPQEYLPLPRPAVRGSIWTSISFRP